MDGCAYAPDVGFNSSLIPLLAQLAMPQYRITYPHNPLSPYSPSQFGGATFDNKLAVESWLCILCGKEPPPVGVRGSNGGVAVVYILPFAHSHLCD